MILPLAKALDKESGTPMGVSPVLAPAPQIQLYGQTITTTQSMFVGQQIALSATVTPPSGTSISSQQWSTPEGTVVGGYTNATGSAPCLLATSCPPPDTTGGKVLALPANTGSSFTFYWINSGNSRQITYTYTLNTGASNSATATFNVAGPTSPSMSAQTSIVQIVAAGYNPLFLGLPGQQFGFYPNSPPGINFTASATLPSGNQGAYSFVQLISKDTIKRIAAPPKNSQTCKPNGFVTDPNPELDNTYPYVSASSNSTNDSPGQALVSSGGEVARSFSPTMYVLWTPNADSRCPSGNACT